MKVTFSPAARDDLLEIALHIAQDNPARALTFAGELEDRCTALGHAPRIGTPGPELGDGVLMLPHGRYLIFYRHTQRSGASSGSCTAHATSAWTTWTRRLARSESEPPVRKVKRSRKSPRR